MIGGGYTTTGLYPTQHEIETGRVERHTSSSLLVVRCESERKGRRKKGKGTLKRRNSKTGGSTGGRLIATAGVPGLSLPRKTLYSSKFPEIGPGEN